METLTPPKQLADPNTGDGRLLLLGFRALAVVLAFPIDSHGQRFFRFESGRDDAGINPVGNCIDDRYDEKSTR